MPEVGIGFIPDVGGTYLLAQTPGRLGLYVALTGVRLQWGRRHRARIRRPFCAARSSRTSSADIASAVPDTALRRHAVEHPSRQTLMRNGIGSKCFAADSVEAILRSAPAAGMTQAGATMPPTVIAGRSPIALSVTSSRAARAKLGLVDGRWSGVPCVCGAVARRRTWLRASAPK